MPSDLGAWVKEHEVCWELRPLRELVKGHGVEKTGYELGLVGRYDAAAQADDEAVARALHERLRGLASQVLGALSPKTEVQVEPFSRETWPAEAGSAIEIELTVILSLPPADPLRPSPEPPPEIAALESRLRSLGLPRRT